MFRTPSPIATYEEPWATIFRVGLRETAAIVCGHLANPHDPEEFGTAVFDRLTTPQKVAMLAIVGKALLIRDEPAPDLTATVDATAYVIFEQFLAELDCESDSDGCAEVCHDMGTEPVTECRGAVRRILEPDWDPDLDGPLPEVRSCDTGRWRDLAEPLEDAILWDQDFEDEELYVDLPPAIGEALKDQMTIESDYFATPAPEPTREELRRHVALIEMLTEQRLDFGIIDS